MKLSSTALTTTLLAAIAAPTTEAWSFGPAGGRIFMRPSPSVLMGGGDCGGMIVTPEQILRRRQEMFNRAFTRVSPRYQIIDNENEVKITLDVPGVKAEDIDVRVEDNDAKVLSISGRREKESSDGSYTTKFSQDFLLDATVDIDKFTADLKNGVLIVTAPKDIQRLEENIRKIPVVEVDASATVDEIQVEQDIPEQVPEDSESDVPTTSSSLDVEVEDDASSEVQANDKKDADLKEGEDSAGDEKASEGEK